MTRSRPVEKAGADLVPACSAVGGGRIRGGKRSHDGKGWKSSWSDHIYAAFLRKGQVGGSSGRGRKGNLVPGGGEDPMGHQGRAQAGGFSQTPWPKETQPTGVAG